MLTNGYVNVGTLHAEYDAIGAGYTFANGDAAKLAAAAASGKPLIIDEIITKQSGVDTVLVVAPTKFHAVTGDAGVEHIAPAVFAALSAPAGEVSVAMTTTYVFTVYDDGSADLTVRT